MYVAVSGLDERACGQLRDQLNKGGIESRWCPCEEFIDALQKGGDADRMLWLYRAPWSLAPATEQPDTDTDPSLDAWRVRNRAVLNARTDRLLLANVERLNVSDVQQLITAPDHSSVGTASTDDVSPGSTALAQLFDMAAPDTWDIFEALEAAAVTSGDAPRFRHTRDPDEADVVALMQSLRASNTLPAIKAQLESAEEELASSRADLNQAHKQHEDTEKKLDQSRAELAEEKTRHAETRQESELLLIQLHQVQEELEQYYLRGLEQQKQLDKEHQEVASAKHKAATTEKALNKALADAKRQATQARQEIEALKLKLAQLQEDLAKAQSPSTALVPVKGSARHRTIGISTLRHAVGRTMAGRQRKTQVQRLLQSGWLNPKWYLETYPDLRAAKVNPAMHYLMTGWRENRNPGPGFDTAYYLKHNPDVRKNNINPLWHYLQYGYKEGRLPRKP